MIEGNDPTDDVWLWMDGDEEWLGEHLDPDDLQGWFDDRELENDWVDAQSAYVCILVSHDTSTTMLEISRKSRSTIPLPTNVQWSTRTC